METTATKIEWQIEEAIEKTESIYRITGFDFDGNDYEGSAEIIDGKIEKIQEYERLNKLEIFRRWTEFIFQAGNAIYTVKLSQSILGQDYVIRKDGDEVAIGTDQREIDLFILSAELLKEKVLKPMNLY